MMRPRRAPLLVAVLVIIGIACFGEAWRTAHQPRRLVAAASSPVMASPTGTQSAPSSGVVSASPTDDGSAAGANITASPPVRVDVPAVGVSAPIEPVGLTADGSIDIPPPTVAGWYREGQAPGGLGPAVLVGHVDSQAGTAVFYRLTGVHVGDQVTVARADGSLARFAISAVTEVRKSSFPTAAVFAPTDGPSLRLITCTGVFDATNHHYVDSLIAWASASP
jgi:hypothetical protein